MNGKLNSDFLHLRRRIMNSQSGIFVVKKIPGRHFYLQAKAKNEERGYRPWWEEGTSKANESNEVIKLDDTGKNKSSFRRQTFQNSYKKSQKGRRTPPKILKKRNDDFSDDALLEFGDWEEFEDGLDMIMMEVVSKVGVAFHEECFQTFQESLRPALGNDGATRQTGLGSSPSVGRDDILGQLLAARGLAVEKLRVDEDEDENEASLKLDESAAPTGRVNGGDQFADSLQLSVERGSASLPKSVSQALSSSLRIGLADLGVDSRKAEELAAAVVEQIAGPLDVAALAFGGAGGRNQWLQFLVGSVRVTLGDLLGREGNYKPSKARILTEEDEDLSL